jgi:hypothetical protein
MGAFSKRRQNIVIPDPDDAKGSATFREKWGWEPHEQIIIRSVFTEGAREAIGNASTQVDGDGNVAILAGTGRTAMLEQMILSWTLTDDSGLPVPVTAESIRALPAEYSTPVLEECDRLATGMGKVAQKRFLASANGHSSENSGGMKPFPLRS